MTKRTAVDLTDPICAHWNDCVDKFGNPLIEQMKITHIKAQRSKSKINKITMSKAGLLNFDDPEFLTLLNQPKFDADAFIRSTKFANEGSDHMRLYIKSSGDQVDEHSKSPIQRIADELHYYVQATEDLQKASNEFAQRRFRGQVELEKLRNDIDVIINDVQKFFDGILERNNKAYEASKELNRIGNNAFLFTLASDIEKMRSVGQFDEIIRVYDKRQKLPYLEKQMPFSLAIQNVEKALKGVEDSLRSKILQMTPKTFNGKYCVLLMGIQSTKNPIIEIIEELKQRCKSEFQREQILDGCPFFENTFPYFKTLLDFLTENYQSSIDLTKQIIEEKLNDLIHWINDYTREAMIEMTKQQEIEVFNSVLHKHVVRISQMWKNMKKVHLVEETVVDMFNDLQTWYREYLTGIFTSILTSNKNAEVLVNTLLQILDGGLLFTPETYARLLSEPILKLMDLTHEEVIVNGEKDVIKSIKMLFDFTLDNGYLNKLFTRYSEFLKTDFSFHLNKYINAVADELIELHKEKLMRNIALDINNYIYNAFFSLNVDWTSSELSIVVEGWTVYTLNKVISFKCDWGDLFDMLREDVIAVIIHELLFVVRKVRDMSKRARQRVLMNVLLLEEVFTLPPLVPKPDPTDPSGQRTIEPEIGALGRHPEKAWCVLEKQLSFSESSMELEMLRKSKQYQAAKNQLRLQLAALS